jgi:2-methylcitrate dehydratase
VEGPDPLADSGARSTLAGSFDLDPGCERVRDAAILPHDVPPLAQTAVEAAIDLAEDAPIDPADVESVRVKTFPDAVPQVDPSAIAAALVDRELAVSPHERTDLQPVGDAVEVTTTEDLASRADRDEVPARVVVECRNGERYESERTWFTGHPAEPASWGTVEETFHAVVGDRYDDDERRAIVDTVRSFEAETAAELTRLLE